jgi:hypothetical protein
MYWQDGSIYKGNWMRGIQNGLGLMCFANGIKKAGLFKDNVLVELLEDANQIGAMEQDGGGKLPRQFKDELKEYFGLGNRAENNEQYLKKKLQAAAKEDKVEPNTLLQMQELAQAPWL